jgi:hypothetical protein
MPESSRIRREIMDDLEKERLRAHLLGYPGQTPESVEDMLNRYEEREEAKEQLVSGRGMSNAMAETFLDRQGYPRPPGWKSVFFFPGSGRPRSKWLFVFLVLLTGLYLL